ncbi:MAG TPA: arylamine N-acetyltransferase [Woeseiaceae bacterium]|nr:arylamine N-acetyltransferase [Woeseiaceae bacterium]
MNLDNYLERIAFTGTARADLPTLSALLKAHVCTVPFENLDVQLGRRLGIAPQDAYEKIVGRRRGGWCFEQNGLFGWALREIGFEVMRLAANVMRQERGELASANHLCLRVNLPGDGNDYFVDVGFGGSLYAPIKLDQGEHTQPPYRLGLTKLDDGYWRFWEASGDEPFGFDFLVQAGDEQAMSTRCAWLQSDPSSSFVQNLVVQLRKPDSHKSLRGRVLTIMTSAGKESIFLHSARELVSVLADEFDLHVPEASGLWPRILARHEELFGSAHDGPG